MKEKSKNIIFLIVIFILSACTNPKLKKDLVSLEDKEWKPVNTNYINRKGF